MKRRAWTKMIASGLVGTMCLWWMIGWVSDWVEARVPLIVIGHDDACVGVPENERPEWCR